MDSTGYGSITISEFEKLFEDEDMQASASFCRTKGSTENVCFFCIVSGNEILERKIVRGVLFLKLLHLEGFIVFVSSLQHLV